MKKYFILIFIAMFVMLLNGASKLFLSKNWPAAREYNRRKYHKARPQRFYFEGLFRFNLRQSSVAKNLKLKLSVGEKVRVYGNFTGGKKKIFDGYVIKKSTGEQIIVSEPSPHLGFIIQTSFK